MKENFESVSNIGSGLTRRVFLAGGATIGVSAALAAVTGCSSTPSASNAADTTNGSNGEWAFEVPPKPIDESLITKTVETGILVIGAGPAGFSTALSALDSGESKVVVVAKGNSPSAMGGSMHAMNSSYAQSIGKGVTPDELSHRLRAEWKAQSNNADEAKYMRAAYNSGKMMDWLSAYMTEAGYQTVMEIAPADDDGVFAAPSGAHGFVGNGIPAAGLGIGAALAVMQEQIIAKGGEINFSTTVEQLVREDDNTGRVTAAIAVTADGEYVKYVAQKGVVLATGCITQNDEMLQRFAPQAYAVKQAGGRMTSPNDGHGTRMALWVGAAPQKNWPWGTAYYVAQFYRFDTETLTLTYTGPRYYNMMPSLAVNAEGKRFMNEDSSCGLGVSPHFKQPGMLSYSIWTKNLAYALAPWEDFGRYYGGEDKGTYTGDEIIEVWDTFLGEGPGGEQALEKARFDTIEEIAEHFKLPIDVLKETISNYNQKCERGVDDEYGKRSARLVPVDLSGPFYVMKTMPCVMAVFGGPRCDVDARVLDKNDAVIEGLYEVGTMMGDIYQNYYTFGLTGVNMGFFCLTYGFMTGKALAEGKI